MSAMELLDNDSCVCFLFTHSLHKEFKFCIGIGNVRFQRLDLVPNPTQRLKKPLAVQPKPENVQMANMQNDEHSNLQLITQLKIEEESNNNFEQQEPSVHQINTSSNLNKRNQTLKQNQKNTPMQKQQQISLNSLQTQKKPNRKILNKDNEEDEQDDEDQQSSSEEEQESQEQKEIKQEFGTDPEYAKINKTSSMKGSVRKEVTEEKEEDGDSDDDEQTEEDKEKKRKFYESVMIDQFF